MVFAREESELSEIDYRDLLAKPFVLGARGPNAYDCWGICLEVGRRAGIEYPEVLTPEIAEAQDEIIRGTIDSFFQKIEKPEPYCIVTFSFCYPFVDHCGIVLADTNYFLHILYQHRVARSRVDFWKKKIFGFYRLSNATIQDI